MIELGFHVDVALLNFVCGYSLFDRVTKFGELSLKVSTERHVFGK